VPPWADSAEEIGAIAVAVVTALGLIAVAVVGVIGTVYAAWRSKVKPLLTKTHAAAETAADQLTPNHGSSARDALGRIERSLEALDRNFNDRLKDIRADMRLETEQNDRAHSEIFRRIRSLETPYEDTRP